MMSDEVMSDKKKAVSACQNVTVLPLIWMLLVSVGQIAAVFVAQIGNRAPSTNASIWSNWVWSSLAGWAVLGGFILNIFIMKWAAARGYKAGAAENDRP
jgi:hypothetical protein